MAKYDFNLKMVEVARIRANPINPRGKFVRDNDDQVQYLKRSIKEFGMLVPIVIKKPKKSGGNYILIDGERRLNAVKELGMKQVPAHVLETNISPDAGKTLMFHVHTKGSNGMHINSARHWNHCTNRSRNDSRITRLLLQSN